MEVGRLETAQRTGQNIGFLAFGNQSDDRLNGVHVLSTNDGVIVICSGKVEDALQPENVKAAKALPYAIRVADRWHLMENASTAFLDAVRKTRL